MNSVASRIFKEWTQTGWGMVVVGVLFRLISFVVLAPLPGLVLRTVLTFSGQSAVADMDIVSFVLHPLGMIGMITVAAVFLCVLALEQATFIVMAMSGRKVTTGDLLTCLHISFLKAPNVLRLTLQIVVRVLMIAVPFLAAGGLIFWLMLTDVDINFYLQNRPPKFLVAASMIGVVLAVMCWRLLPRVAGWFVALPILMMEKEGPWGAIRVSEQRTMGHRKNIGIGFVAWIGISLLLSMVLSAATVFIARSVVPPFTGSVTILITVLGALLIIYSLASLAISLTQSILFSLLMTDFYRQTLPEEKAVPVSVKDIPQAESKFWSQLTWPRLASGVVILALFSGLIGVWLVDGVRPVDDVLIIAHRGASGSAPENTLSSVRRALDENADQVEIDVQETADGEVVVFHDSDFMKVSRVNLKIWDATLEKLSQIDIGSHFSSDFDQERVPTLKEVLEVCSGHAVVNIELKYYGHDQDLERKVVQIVEETGMTDSVVLMSLKLDAVKKMKKLRPDWTVGLLTATAIGDLTKLEADFLAVNSSLISHAFVDRAHDRGKDVYCWTVNDSIQMSLMMSQGVDGIITDFPGLARRVIQQRMELNTVERLLLELAYNFGVITSAPGPEQ
ncbi:glycerophosphodiester phosphodiesterase [Thalassoglobus sp. JC818]|uniref:glycerophosphodiester phosphodiesterase n=1 Tax=Thalassoglobus sp. JC818 TaxID=3232136 RepID=UPI00345B16F6